MNSMERYQKMLSMTPYADRSEMPVFPMMLVPYATFAGMTQAETIADPMKWLQAMEITFEKIGRPDIVMPMCPRDTIFVMGLPARVPGVDLGENELYQFVETPFFDDPSEYEKILQMGWQAWHGMYMCQIQNPPLTSPDQLMARYGLMGETLGMTMGHIYSKGMEPDFHSATAPIFDTLSMARSMEEFIYDLYDDPGPIMDVINKFQAEADMQTIGMLKANHGTRVGCFAMRSCATFLSPDMFEEYAWPALKGMIERFHEAGIMMVLHADADWTPMLEYFLQVPKGSVHLELDGMTDMEKAYDILGGWQTIRGDVPATMLAYGTADEVREYCEKLINMGMKKGGFVLGSGCEVPMNAKIENVKAIIDSVRG